MLGSVRARAAAGATVVVALALIAAGTAVLLVLRGNLQNQARLQAQVAAHEVAVQIATGTPYDKLELPDGDDHPVVVTAEGGQVLAVGEDVRAVDGKRVAASQGKGTVVPSAEDEDGDEDGDEGALKPGEVDEDVTYRDGTADVDGTVADYRFAVIQAKDGRGAEATVRAGAELAPEQDAVASVRDAMLIGLPLLLVVVAGVTWLVTRRALRPVEGIRGEMAAITASTDLSRRVPVPSSKDEIGRLARTTNETLAALESAVERQRRFVADASHELRSPIASLRTQLEVGWRTRSCWMCRARWRTPCGCSGWRRICCCWPGWTRGSGRPGPGSIWRRWCARRVRSGSRTGSRCVSGSWRAVKWPGPAASWRGCWGICSTMRSGMPSRPCGWPWCARGVGGAAGRGRRARGAGERAGADLRAVRTAR